MHKRSIETTVGVFLAAGLLCIGYMAVRLGDLSIRGDNMYPLYARFTSVTGLRVGTPVYMLGLEVGKTRKLTMDQESQQVVVEIRLKKGIKVYDDAIAAIKTEGLIGDKTLTLDPGGSGELLPPGGVITETQPPVEVSDLISRYAFGTVGKAPGAPNGGGAE